MILHSDSGDHYWNYIGAPAPEDARFIFSSTAGLYKHAKEAGVKFEVAVVHVLTSLLVAYFFDWGYHHELRPCPMDFTEDHETIIPALRKAKFCKLCQSVLSQNEHIRDAVIALIGWGR